MLSLLHRNDLQDGGDDRRSGPVPAGFEFVATYRDEGLCEGPRNLADMDVLHVGRADVRSQDSNGRGRLRLCVSTDFTIGYHRTVCILAL